jgi:hypothetical protein
MGSLRAKFQGRKEEKINLFLFLFSKPFSNRFQKNFKNPFEFERTTETK